MRRFLHFANQTNTISNSILKLDLHFPDADGQSAHEFNTESESESAMVSDKQGNEGECF